jgi:hypothetical protein
VKRGALRISAMTRRGSLAYYFAAVAFGCVLMTLGMWLPHGRPGWHGTPSTEGFSGFFVACFFGFLFGTAPSLIFGFVLRQLMHRLRWTEPWRWMTAGAAIAFVEVWILSKLAVAIRESPAGAGAEFAVAAFLAGADIVRTERHWASLPVGALTALILFRVHGAFEPAAGAGEKR